MKGWHDYEIRICKSQIRSHSGESLTKVSESISKILNKSKNTVTRFLKMNDELVDFRKTYNVYTWNEKVEMKMMEEIDKEIEEELANGGLVKKGDFKITYHTQPKRTYGKSCISDKFEVGKSYYVSNHCGEKSNSLNRLCGNARLISKTDRFGVFDFKDYKSCFLWNCYGIDWKARNVR
jgi:hypothetical protein